MENLAHERMKLFEGSADCQDLYRRGAYRIAALFVL